MSLLCFARVSLVHATYLLETNEDPHCRGVRRRGRGKPWTPRARARSWMSITENGVAMFCSSARAYFGEAQVEVEVIRAIKRERRSVIKLVTISHRLPRARSRIRSRDHWRDA